MIKTCKQVKSVMFWLERTYVNLLEVLWQSVRIERSSNDHIVVYWALTVLCLWLLPCSLRGGQGVPFKFITSPIWLSSEYHSLIVADIVVKCYYKPFVVCCTLCYLQSQYCFSTVVFCSLLYLLGVHWPGHRFGLRRLVSSSDMVRSSCSHCCRLGCFVLELLRMPGFACLSGVWFV